LDGDELGEEDDGTLLEDGHGLLLDGGGRIELLVGGLLLGVLTGGLLVGGKLLVGGDDG